MNAKDVLNYYLAHPPFEITDAMGYAELLQTVADTSVMELSENDPILEETRIISEALPGGMESYTDSVFFDLTALHKSFMELVLFQEIDLMETVMSQLLYQSCQIAYNSLFSTMNDALNAAIRENSVISYLAVKDSMGIIEEYYETKIAKMIFKGNLIKVKPSTAYYAVFRRYRTIDEISRSSLLNFKRLFEINLFLAIYQSDIFSAEGGIRSVSLSGLSVSFNVPSADTKVRQLIDEKQRILSSIAIDYSDIGVI